MKLDINEIMKLIPQRYPFLFVDRVEELVKGEKIIALKNVSINEQIFAGHFPGSPTLPGVIIIEALAQTSGILAMFSIPELTKGKPYLAGVNSFKFRHPIYPGDNIILESTLKKRVKNFINFYCRAIVKDKVVAEGELLTALVKVEE